MVMTLLFICAKRRGKIHVTTRHARRGMTNQTAQIRDRVHQKRTTSVYRQMTAQLQWPSRRQPKIRPQGRAKLTCPILTQTLLMPMRH